MNWSRFKNAAEGLLLAARGHREQKLNGADAFRQMLELHRSHDHRSPRGPRYWCHEVIEEQLPRRQHAERQAPVRQAG